MTQDPSHSTADDSVLDSTSHDATRQKYSNLDFITALERLDILNLEILIFRKYASSTALKRSSNSTSLNNSIA